MDARIGGKILVERANDPKAVIEWARKQGLGSEGRDMVSFTLSLRESQVLVELVELLPEAKITMQSGEMIIEGDVDRSLDWAEAHDYLRAKKLAPEANSPRAVRVDVYSVEVPTLLVDLAQLSG